MSVNGKIIYLIGCALLLSIESFSKTIYVSEKSDGNGNGNIDKPLASIEIALRRAQAGDVIEIELETASDNKDLGQFDETQSGKYIILHLCHHFDEKRSVTALTLVRDTYGRRKK